SEEDSMCGSATSARRRRKWCSNRANPKGIPTTVTHGADQWLFVVSGFGRGFHVRFGNKRSQAAQMVLEPGKSEGDPDNRHPWRRPVAFRRLRLRKRIPCAVRQQALAGGANGARTGQIRRGSRQPSPMAPTSGFSSSPASVV